MSDTTDTQGADPTGTELLASAYLDGEVTPEERAQVEASQEVLAEVERLRQVRAVLGATTEPPPISVREEHLAAALDVWDRMPETERAGEVTPSAGMDAAAAAAISTPAPTSLSSRRDRRSGRGTTKWLLGAAAGLAVIAGAGVVLQGLGSSSDNDSAGDASEAEAPAEEPASENVAVAESAADEFIGAETESAPAQVNADDVEAEDGRSDVEFAEEPASESVDEAIEEEAPAEAAMEEEDMEEEAMEAEPAPADQTSDDAEDPARPELDLEALESPQDLADFGAIAFYADVDADAPVDPNIEPAFNTCDVEFAGTFDFDTFAGPALYLGEEIIVAVDITQAPPSVIAFTETCAFVASAPLPSQEALNQRRLDDQDS